MANITTWTGTTVGMSNTLAAPVTITSISKATSGVVTTAVTTGVTVGSYILVNSTGMGQVNGRVFRVSAVASNSSITLESEDTTNYDTFSTGSYQIVSFPNTLATLTSVSGSGGDFDKIDSTLLGDTVKSSIPGMASAVEFTFDSVYDVADASLAAANAASTIQDKRAFSIKWRNNQRIVFVGYVGCQMVPNGSLGQMVTTKISITANGGLKAYAS